VLGTAHWDRIMSRAAGSVLVVAEKLVDSAVFEANPESTLIPFFMVQAYAVVPQGAWPGSCWPDYAIDYPAVEAYMDKQGDLRAHMAAAPEAREVQHG
jgi:glutaconate CoA-transferase subunit A